MALFNNSGRRIIGSNDNAKEGVLSRVATTVSDSPIYQKSKKNATYAANSAMKLLKSTGKAAWIVGTTLLVITLSLIIEIESDSQLDAWELQQGSLLGTPPDKSS